MASHTTVPKLYRSVVEDVINNVRESFLDDGVDEQVLQELKQLWESKLLQSKAMDGIQADQDRLYALYQNRNQKPQAAQVAVSSATAAATTTQRQVIAPQVTVTQQSQLPVQYNPAQGNIQLSSAAQNAANALPLALYQQHLAGALQSGTITLQTGQGGAQIIVAPQGVIQQPAQGGATFTVNPQQFAALQAQAAARQAQAATQQQTQQQDVKGNVIQIDGANDSSSEEDFDKDDDDSDDDEKDENEENNDLGEEEESLNSADDVSDQEPSELFDTDNIVVCQYDKINRNKNKWKFHLKDGIMNLNGKDYVFQKATGEAEW